MPPELGQSAGYPLLQPVFKTSSCPLALSPGPPEPSQQHDHQPFSLFRPFVAGAMAARERATLHVAPTFRIESLMWMHFYR
jgi:hypothetical protein